MVDWGTCLFCFFVFCVSVRTPRKHADQSSPSRISRYALFFARHAPLTMSRFCSDKEKRPETASCVSLPRVLTHVLDPPKKQPSRRIPQTRTGNGDQTCFNCYKWAAWMRGHEGELSLNSQCLSVLAAVFFIFSRILLFFPKRRIFRIDPLETTVFELSMF